MAKRRMTADFAPKVKEILQNACAYHKTCYKLKTFGGPSLYFHRRALGLEGKISKSLQLEFIYATLSSWGMHRMGSNGAKMQAFDTFKNSVQSVRNHLSSIRQLNPASLTSKKWGHLEYVFKKIKVMESGTSIVGNSKVMAHLLPKIVSPIDREYTFKYLFGSNYLPNDLTKEWLLMRKILEKFFYTIALNKKFQLQAKGWISNQNEFPWDTSILKVIDNLVIGRMKQ